MKRRVRLQIFIDKPNYHVDAETFLKFLARQCRGLELAAGLTFITVESGLVEIRQTGGALVTDDLKKVGV